LRQNPDKAAAKEEAVIQGWDNLKVPNEFTRIDE
jgi:hypothetical protein